MPITNLGKAEKILEGISSNNIKDKKAVKSGDGCTLNITVKDIYDFAYGKNGNVLDKLDGIGRLLAESLLTRTTGHKMNDFNGVYYNAHDILSRYRPVFLKWFIKYEQSNENIPSLDSGSLQKIEELIKDSQNKTVDSIINQLVVIFNIPESEKKEFFKNMKKHAQNIERNSKKLQEILKNKNVVNMISQQLRECDEQTLQKTILEETNSVGFKVSNDFLQEVDRVTVRLAESDLDLVFPPGFFAVVCMIGAIGAISVSAFTVGVSALAVATLLGVSAILLAMLNNRRLAVSRQIRKYKNMFINLHKASSGLFEEMGLIQKEFLLRRASNKNASLFESNLPIYQKNAELQNIIRGFINALGNEWTKYANAESRVYMDFSKLVDKTVLQDLKRVTEEIAKVESDINVSAQQKCGLQSKIQILTDKWSGQKNALLDANNRGGATKEIDKIVTDSIENINKQIDKKKKELSQVESELKELEGKLSSLKTEKEQLQKKLDVPIHGSGAEGKHRSGILKKSNAKKSSLGLFKQGLANLWCQIQYPYRRVSTQNIDLSLD